jgi:N-acetylmuramoyl-L-alanine amidase
MPALFRHLTLFFFFALFGLIGSAQARTVKTVVIDAGHGAHDFGCREGSLLEKHLALDIARRLERCCRRAGFRVVMTRSTDSFVPLETRAAIGNAQDGAVFVSLHINDASSSSASGLETFYNSSEGQILATHVQREMISGTTNGGNRGVKSARFKVLRFSRVPAILVEAGFISNSRDEVRLRDPAYREAIAQSILSGLQSFKRQ